MMSSLIALLRIARSKSAVAPRLVGGVEGGCGGMEGRQLSHSKTRIREIITIYMCFSSQFGEPATKPEKVGHI